MERCVLAELELHTELLLSQSVEIGEGISSLLPDAASTTSLRAGVLFARGCQRPAPVERAKHNTTKRARTGCERILARPRLRITTPSTTDCRDYY